MPSYSNNYSKWDNLELSDDSDIEGHPNVDKKSLIRWKQRDIHEKREIRKQTILQCQNEIKSNNVLIPRLEGIASDLASGGPPYFSQLVERLRTQGSPDAPTDLPGQPTYDQMIESLLTTVFGEVKNKGIDKDNAKLGDALVGQLQSHITQLKKRDGERKVQLEKELKEQARHITSDDLKDGWDATSVAPKLPAPEPAIKPKAKTSTSTIEVLNPSSASTSASSPSPAPPAKKDDSDSDSDDDDDGEELPRVTPSLLAFSQIPYRAFEESFEFVKRDKSVFVEGATDALLLAGFNAEQKGDSKYAKQCVHQGLIIQYCEKLGKDGVSLFFRRMVNGNSQALDIFLKDVEDTYTLLARRARISAEEAAEAAKSAPRGEQIQLVAENPSTVISFDVPEGPPPEHLVLEGPGTEDLDIEEVRKTLQTRWDIYEGFDEKFKKALQSNSLDKVNKVLGKMSIEEAENVVELLQIAGILSFAEGGIRDETGGPSSSSS